MIHDAEIKELLRQKDESQKEVYDFSIQRNSPELSRSIDCSSGKTVFFGNFIFIAMLGVMLSQVPC